VPPGIRRRPNSVRPRCEHVGVNRRWTCLPLLLAMVVALPLTACVSVRVVKVRNSPIPTTIPVNNGGSLVPPSTELATTTTIPPAFAQMTVQITLSATRTVAGSPIKGSLVITNPGPAVNLTRLEPSGCMPGFGVYLTNGTISNPPAFAADCIDKPLVIAQGTTTLPFTISTMYEACTQQSAETTPEFPMCLSSGMPPLPPGTYQATIEWSPTVPLPQPRPVTVTLTVGSSVSSG
jgi:hypothetical protein